MLELLGRCEIGPPSSRTAIGRPDLVLCLHFISESMLYPVPNAKSAFYTQVHVLYPVCGPQSAVVL